MTTNEQLELGINGNQSSSHGSRHPDRTARAAWWFGQMRRIVANAIDWQAIDQSRNQQQWFGNPQSK